MLYTYWEFLHTQMLVFKTQSRCVVTSSISWRPQQRKSNRTTWGTLFWWLVPACMSKRKYVRENQACAQQRFHEGFKTWLSENGRWASPIQWVPYPRRNTCSMRFQATVRHMTDSCFHILIYSSLYSISITTCIILSTSYCVTSLPNKLLSFFDFHSDSAEIDVLRYMYYYDAFRYIMGSCFDKVYQRLYHRLW